MESVLSIIVTYQIIGDAVVKEQAYFLVHSVVSTVSLASMQRHLADINLLSNLSRMNTPVNHRFQKDLTPI